LERCIAELLFFFLFLFIFGAYGLSAPLGQGIVGNEMHFDIFRAPNDPFFIELWRENCIAVGSFISLSHPRKPKKRRFFSLSHLVWKEKSGANGMQGQGTIGMRK
jgi:hypothetical protein